MGYKKSLDQHTAHEYLERGCRQSVAILSTLLGTAGAAVLAFGHMMFHLGVDATGVARQFSWQWVIPVSLALTFIPAWLITLSGSGEWPNCHMRKS